MKYSQGIRYMTGVSHLKKARQGLKTCKEYIFCRESYDQCSWDFEGILFDFLKEQQTINAAYYLKLLKDLVKPAFCSE
jgi:hypothetical protein